MIVMRKILNVKQRRSIPGNHHPPRDGFDYAAGAHHDMVERLRVEFTIGAAGSSPRTE
jgi:hypothetical protein